MLNLPLPRQRSTGAHSTTLPASHGLDCIMTAPWQDFANHFRKDSQPQSPTTTANESMNVNVNVYRTQPTNRK